MLARSVLPDVGVPLPMRVPGLVSACPDAAWVRGYRTKGCLWGLSDVSCLQWYLVQHGQHVALLYQSHHCLISFSFCILWAKHQSSLCRDFITTRTTRPPHINNK